MAQVTVNWTQNPAEEIVSGYNAYVDGVLATPSPIVPPFVSDMAMGLHNVEIAAVNAWGEGPKSDPVSTPPAPSKPTGVSISITVNVTVNT